VDEEDGTQRIMKMKWKHGRGRCPRMRLWRWGEWRTML